VGIFSADDKQAKPPEGLAPGEATGEPGLWNVYRLPDGSYAVWGDAMVEVRDDMTVVIVDGEVVRAWPAQASGDAV
jgi:hypothetical protein